jgi:hypothetical protein
MQKKFKPGERFNAFQAKKKEYEKKHRKAMPTFGAIGAGQSKGLNAGVSAGNMGLVAPKAMKAPKIRRMKRKVEKKRKRKEHSEESIKALREFADDESKEKGRKAKHRKEHSSEEISGLRKFVDEEAKEKGKKAKKKTLRSPKEVVKSEQNASRQFKKKHKKSFNTTTKKTGKFEGKSNVLGHGGRAAQLKARGVPGGVIGAMARAAHAAPGQANYHGKHKKGAHCKTCSC